MFSQLEQIVLGSEYIYNQTSQPGPGDAWEKFNEIKLPIYTFYTTKSFLSRDQSEFWSLGYPGVQGLGWRGHACVKNLPRVGVEVVQNLVEIGPAVRAWKGNIGKYIRTKYKQSLLYICRDGFMWTFSLTWESITLTSYLSLLSHPLRVKRQSNIIMFYLPWNWDDKLKSNRWIGNKWLTTSQLGNT